MKSSILLAIFPALAVLAAPVAEVPVENAVKHKRSSDIEPLDDASKVMRREDDTSDLVLKVLTYDDEEKKTKAKRGSDVENVVLRGIYDTDDGAAGKKAKTKRGSDVENVVLRGIYDTDDDEKRKIKRDDDTSDLVLKVLTYDDEKVRRGDDTSDLVLKVLTYDDDEKVKRKIISPYSDDVAAADRHAVLGE